jgi:hypothetical protein
MPSIREVILSLYGVWRLASLDRKGLDCLDASAAGAARSFWAAVLIAPFYAVMVAAGGGAHTGGIRFVLAESIAYVVTWTAYPVAVEWLSGRLGCRDRFEGYLAAYNWSMVLQNALALPIGILARLGVLPPDVAQALWLLVFTLIVGYVFFIARAALGVGAMTAAGLVMLDVMLSAFIDVVAAGMS